MKPRVRPEAFQEALQAALWYDEKRGGLGDDFYDEVLKTIEVVGRTPLRFPLYEALSTVPPVRRAPVKRFPYYVIYSFLDGDAEPLIVAICHARQRPGFWADRI
jgi:toxin ParE1/3/4